MAFIATITCSAMLLLGAYVSTHDEGYTFELSESSEPALAWGQSRAQRVTLRPATIPPGM